MILAGAFLLFCVLHVTQLGGSPFVGGYRNCVGGVLLFFQFTGGGSVGTNKGTNGPSTETLPVQNLYYGEIPNTKFVLRTNSRY